MFPGSSVTLLQASSRLRFQLLTSGFWHAWAYSGKGQEWAESFLKERQRVRSDAAVIRMSLPCLCFVTFSQAGLSNLPSSSWPLLGPRSFWTRVCSPSPMETFFVPHSCSNQMFGPIGLLWGLSLSPAWDLVASQGQGSVDHLWPFLTHGINWCSLAFLSRPLVTLCPLPQHPYVCSPCNPTIHWALPLWTWCFACALPTWLSVHCHLDHSSPRIFHCLYRPDWIHLWPFSATWSSSQHQTQLDHLFLNMTGQWDRCWVTFWENRA